MYYPKSQITSNLYTNGDEFVYVNNQQTYKGFYFKTSTGKYYSGKNPSDKPNVEIVPIINQPNELEDVPTLEPKNIIALEYEGVYPTDALLPSVNFYNENTILDYIKLKNIPFNNPPIKFLPYYSPTLPTQQDYQIGEFQRYFCKKTNEILYIEINQEQFDKLVGKDPQIEFSLYQPFTITWILTGDKQQVAKTNKNIVELASVRQKLPKFDQYLKFDYTKYFQ